jgi:hypothetical protein
MNSRGRNGRSLPFSLKTLRELSGHKVDDGRLDSAIESTQLILGYGVSNITLFKPPEPYQKKKKFYRFASAFH